MYYIVRYTRMRLNLVAHAVTNMASSIFRFHYTRYIDYKTRHNRRFISNKLQNKTDTCNISTSLNNTVERIQSSNWKVIQLLLFYHYRAYLFLQQLLPFAVCPQGRWEATRWVRTVDGQWTTRALGPQRVVYDVIYTQYEIQVIITSIHHPTHPAIHQDSSWMAPGAFLAA